MLFRSNKSLFLGISRVLCNFTVEEITKKNKNRIVQQLNDAINTEGEFRGALSMATNDAKNIKIVYETVKKIIGE